MKLFVLSIVVNLQLRRPLPCTLLGHVHDSIVSMTTMKLRLLCPGGSVLDLRRRERVS